MRIIFKLLYLFPMVFFMTNHTCMANAANIVVKGSTTVPPLAKVKETPS